MVDPITVQRIRSYLENGGSRDRAQDALDDIAPDDVVAALAYLDDAQAQINDDTLVHSIETSFRRGQSLSQIKDALVGEKYTPEQVDGAILRADLYGATNARVASIHISNFFIFRVALCLIAIGAGFLYNRVFLIVSVFMLISTWFSSFRSLNRAFSHGQDDPEHDGYNSVIGMIWKFWIEDTSIISMIFFFFFTIITIFTIDWICALTGFVYGIFAYIVFLQEPQSDVE